MRWHWPPLIKLAWLISDVTENLTFRMVMFHVKLSTALCSFLPFKPSFTARSWRFSWNSIAAREKQTRMSVESVRCLFRKEEQLLREWSLGYERLARLVVTVRKRMQAKTLACTVDIHISPAAENFSLRKYRDSPELGEHYCLLTARIRSDNGSQWPQLHTYQVWKAGEIVL